MPTSLFFKLFCDIFVDIFYDVSGACFHSLTSPPVDWPEVPAGARVVMESGDIDPITRYGSPPQRPPKNFIYPNKKKRLQKEVGGIPGHPLPRWPPPLLLWTV